MKTATVESRYPTWTYPTFRFNRHSSETSENECNENENSETTELAGDRSLPLLQRIPGCEEATMEDVDEWINSDQQTEVTYNEIDSSAC